MIATLVFLKTPWTYISLIANAFLASYPQEHSGKELSVDNIKDITVKAIEKEPELIAQANDSNHHRTHQALTWLAECRLCAWLLCQNFKGIAPPSESVITHYLKLWGMGPHRPRLAQHLNKFKKDHSRRKWMMVFRRRWGFHFAAMRQGTILNTDEVQKNVLHDKIRDQGGCPGTRFGEALGQLWVRDCVHPHAPRSGYQVVYPKVTPCLVPILLPIRHQHGTHFWEHVFVPCFCPTPKAKSRNTFRYRCSFCVAWRCAVS